MQWQRTAEQLIKRWSGLDAVRGDFRLAELADTVSPVVVIGSDHPDEERPTFFQAFEASAGGAGFINHVTLSAVLGDVEVLGAWASCPSAALKLHVSFGTHTLIALTSVAPSSGAAGSYGQCDGATIGGAGTDTHFAALQDTLVSLPFRGTILEVGRRIRLENAVDNLPLTAGFVWRNAGRAQ